MDQVLSLSSYASRKALTVSVTIAALLCSLVATLFVGPLTAHAANCTSGTLIKGSQSAVYYCGADGKRYVFTNQKSYNTWYSDFSGVTTISDSLLASIMIGGNVTYRPGVKMIKIQSDVHVYAVAHNGALRWVTNEGVASCLYGSSWNFTSVDDVSDAFFVNYTQGAPIDSCDQYNKFVEMAASSSINQDKNLPPSGDFTSPTVNFTNPASGATNVSLNAQIQATFSEQMDPSTINSGTFMVRNSSGALMNGSVGYFGQTAIFTPAGNLSTNTTYTATVTTGVRDSAGNSMSSNYAWSFTTGSSFDTTAPTITSVDPTNGQSSVNVNKQISATFSEQMDPATINSGTFLLRRGILGVSGTVTYSGNTAHFSPTGNLSPNTTYTATVNSQVKDLSGNNMASDYVWSFTTGNSFDTTAPMVTSTDPTSGETNVALTKVVHATFSEAMESSSINSSSFNLKSGSTTVPGSVSYSGNTANFTPNSNLAPNTAYTATVTTGARDAAGNNMSNDYVWTFTTGATPDVTAPMVVSTDPSNGMSNVSLNKHISAMFSEAMNPTSINSLTFFLTQGGNQVPGTVSYNGTTATFSPTLNMTASTTYTATVTTGATDSTGNHLASDYTWSFTTGTSSDVTAPMVSSTDPANGATNISRSKVVTATFNEPMDPSTINGSTFMLRQGVNTISGTVGYSNSVASFTSSAMLAANTTYTATISTGAHDSSGNALAADYIWSFTTGN